MRVGVPKEIKVLENRVGLVPGSVREVVSHGHQVIVEHNAGQGIGMDDDAYRRAGATIAATAAEVFASADMRGFPLKREPGARPGSRVASASARHHFGGAASAALPRFE